MKSLINHIRSLKNSPTSARDLSQILSPIRLSVWFTIFNGVVILAFYGLYTAIQDVSAYPNSEDAVFLTSSGLGQTFASFLFCAIGVFLTIFVPIRIFGFLFGPRTNRYLDQIVISGISPTRYMAGKVILQNLFFLIVMAASIPYLVLCFSMGGVSISFVLAAIFALWLYTNLLCLLTMAASVFMFEIVAMPLVILLCLLSIFAGVMPLPNPLSLTPCAVFLAPLWSNVLENISQELGVLKFIESFGLLGIQLAMYILTTVFVSLCLFVFLSIGPVFSIASAPFRAFGTVIMPGDSKRKSFFRRRGSLRRRGEVAFLYENRPNRVKSWDLPLRWGLKEVVFIAILIVGAVYIHIFVSFMWQYEAYATLVVFGIGVLLLNSYLFNRDKSTVALRYPSMAAATADRICFFSNLALVFMVVFLGIALREDLFGEITFRSMYFLSDHPGGFVRLGIVISVVAAAYYAMAQFWSTKLWSNFRAHLVAGGFLAITLLKPLIAFTKLTRGDLAEVSSGKVEFYAIILMISPVSQVADFFGELYIGRYVDTSIWPCVAVHAFIAISFFQLAGMSRRKAEAAQIEQAK